jgi:hypothetical protein
LAAASCLLGRAAKLLLPDLGDEALTIRQVRHHMAEMNLIGFTGARKPPVRRKNGRRRSRGNDGEF